MKKCVVLCLALLIAFTQCQAIAEKGIVKINDNWLNVRKEPSELSKVIGQLENGIEIEYEYIDNSYSYLALKSGNSTIGYIASVYVEREPKTKGIFDQKKYIVLCDIDMVSDTKGDVQVTGTLTKDQEVSGVTTNDSWIHIVGGGFVPKNSLKEIKEKQNNG